MRKAVIQFLLEVACISTLRVETAESGCIVPTIRNGYVIYARNRTVARTTTLDVGSVVTTACDPDYAKDSNDTYACTENGDWQPSLSSQSARCLPDFSDCGRIIQSQPYIYSGSYAAFGELPWMAKLDIQSSLGSPKPCGAFLISKNWLLTAAHCASLNGERVVAVTAHLGRTNFSAIEPPGVVRTTSAYCVHPNYDPSSPSFDYDFALLRIDTVRYSKQIRPICLPSQSQCSPSYTNDQRTIDGCSDVMSAGWGLTRIPDRPPMLSNSLKKVNLTLYSKDDCFRMSSNNITDSQLCAASVVSGEDTCQGDSGGPLTCIQNEKVVAIGIVSNGPINCGAGMPGAIYSRICNVLPWITAITNGNGDCQRLTSSAPVPTVSTSTSDMATVSPSEETLSVTCTAPRVEHGSVVQRNGGTVLQGASLEVGSVISLTCDSGFVPTAGNAGSKTCSKSGKWTPNSTEYSCIALPTCPDTVRIIRGRSLAGSSIVGARRTISCDNGYALQGVSFVTCQENQTWSQTAWCVQLNCAAPSAIGNGYYAYFSNVNNGLLSVGASRRIFCNPGFSFSGANNIIVCQPSGLWSSTTGSCTPAVTQNVNYTAWFTAAIRGAYLDIVLMMQRGVDVNKKNLLELTALHYVAQQGRDDIARLLLQNGARPDESTSAGMTPLLLACSKCQTDVATLLIDHGADINSPKYTHGWTPLIVATRGCCLNIVKKLIYHSQFNSMNVRDDQGKTALQYAIDKPNVAWYNLVDDATCDLINIVLKGNGATV